MVLELYAKMYVKMLKIRLRKKCYNFGTNKKSILKLDTTVLRPVALLCQCFEFVYFNRFEKKTVKERVMMLFCFPI